MSEEEKMRMAMDLAKQGIDLEDVEKIALDIYEYLKPILELVEKLKDNMYKELWIISGHKGGYETYKDFGTKLIKDIELIEEREEKVE